MGKEDDLMNCEVQHLNKNMRYRILIINEEYYILDMERSFWKVIFPFFFWMFPSPVYKVEDRIIIDQLKGPKIGKPDKFRLASLGGFGYGIGVLLVPAMYYFDTSISFLFSMILLVFSLVLVVILNLFISYKRKKNLYDVVELSTLQRAKLWIHPSSFKHILKVLAGYIWFLALSILFFIGFIKSQNTMLLFIASCVCFMLLLAIRATVQEGHTTVKFKRSEKVF